MWRNKPLLHLLYLDHFILDQLHLEERLMRLGVNNYCLLNKGSTPSVVMGISKKPEQELHPTFFSKNIPLIQRFSGGGTVFVDQDTFFFTLILNKKDLLFPAFPEKIMQAIEPIFQKFCPKIELKDNDFVIGNKKIAGNAQYLTKTRALHHTSFLWDFDPTNMEYLLFPNKVPAYREKRGHLDFLTTLKKEMEEKDLFASFQQALGSFFHVEKINLGDISHLNQPLNIATKLIDTTSFNTEDSLCI